jgi:hypothetical protein
VLLVEVLILLILFLVFIQDMMSRAVYWILFPVLTVLFILLRILQHQHIAELWQPVLFNIGFLFIQMLTVSAWFSFKNRRWVNVAAQFIGWGDILLLTAIAFYLSVLNFLFFYIASLIIVLLIWLIGQAIFKIKNKHIPLAGLQALTFALYLASDWWSSHMNVANDYWLQQIFIK